MTDANVESEKSSYFAGYEGNDWFFFLYFFPRAQGKSEIFVSIYHVITDYRRRKFSR